MALTAGLAGAAFSRASKFQFAVAAAAPPVEALPRTGDGFMDEADTGCGEKSPDEPALGVVVPESPDDAGLLRTVDIIILKGTSDDAKEAGPAFAKEVPANREPKASKPPVPGETAFDGDFTVDMVDMVAVLPSVDVAEYPPAPAGDVVVEAAVVVDAAGFGWKEVVDGFRELVVDENADKFPNAFVPEFPGFITAEREALACCCC